MIYVVYDSETTIRNVGENAVGSMSASPFHPDNFVVAYGELGLKGGEENVNLQYSTEPDLPPPWVLTTDKPVLVIGHNIGFDLMYMWKMWPDKFWAKLSTLYIWDTQQAEYLLSGHERLFNSLDELSELYGLPLKIDTVKTEYWDKGIDTVFVPKQLLLDYLGSADIHNPLYIFREQWKQLEANPKLMALAKVKMDDVLMTTIMTINGMQFDLEYAQSKLEELDKEIETLQGKLIKEGEKYIHVGFDPDSPTHISIVVFGGSYKVEEDVVQNGPDGRPYMYKSGKKKGQFKTKKTKVVYTTKGLKLKPGIAPKLKNGLYSSESDYLLQHEEHPFIKDVLRYRELQKDANTYFRGYSKWVFPDGRIHQQINQAATDTGRQSSSKPNLQNVTKEDE